MGSCDLAQVDGAVDAGVAQLAEHNVANVVVVGSNPITRSFLLFLLHAGNGCRREPIATIRSAAEPTAKDLRLERRRLTAEDLLLLCCSDTIA